MIIKMEVLRNYFISYFAKGPRTSHYAVFLSHNILNWLPLFARVDVGEGWIREIRNVVCIQDGLIEIGFCDNCGMWSHIEDRQLYCGFSVQEVD